MDADRDAAADDVAALKEALAVERAKGFEVAAELAVARAKASKDEALIAQQKLQIAKLRHQIYGQRSERSSRLIEQLTLTFEELEADATEDELAAGNGPWPGRRRCEDYPQAHRAPDLSGAPSSRAGGDRSSDRL